MLRVVASYGAWEVSRQPGCRGLCACGVCSAVSARARVVTHPPANLCPDPAPHTDTATAAVSILSFGVAVEWGAEGQPPPAHGARIHTHAHARSLMPAISASPPVTVRATTLATAARRAPSASPPISCLLATVLPPLFACLDTSGMCGAACSIGSLALACLLHADPNALSFLSAPNALLLLPSAFALLSPVGETTVSGRAQGN